MNLDTQIHVVADSIPIHAHGVDRVVDLVCVCLEVWDIASLVQERRQVAHCREPPLPSHPSLPGPASLGYPKDMVVDPRLVSRLAAQQLICRNSEMLTHNVHIAMSSALSAP